MPPGKYGEMNYKEIFENTYKGKKVLLTGHTGFKGSWMLAWLHQLGAEVKGYALLPENETDLYNVINGDKLCDSVIADIRDKEKIKKTVIDFQPDFIFHFAAQPLVRRSYELPLYTFEVNVNGTGHLLEAVHDLHIPCNVVIITTDKVYENKEVDYAYKETDKLGGHDPYSASKAAAEIVVSSYRNSFFNNHDFDKHRKAIATARAGNVIGGGDWAKDRIVPDIIRALQTNQPVVVRNPGAIRPWQHVLEPLSGYLLLGAKLTEDPEIYADAWNFGPRDGDVANVENIVKETLQLWGSGSYSVQTKQGEVHEANLLRLDISKSGNILKWKPRLDINESLALVVQGYKELAAGNNNFIFQQIEKYMNQLKNGLS
jgi:CDP-glucose 4,6-dehydratase